MISAKNELLLQGGNVTTSDIVRVAKFVGTPAYLYDEAKIRTACREFAPKTNEFIKHIARYAMKANSAQAILQITNSEGMDIDASSLNEVRRAHIADIPYSNIMLTSQEVYEGEDMGDLENMMLDGLRYNVCSMRQQESVADFASRHKIPLSMRVHPGEGGSGESSTRDTANPYSCFGVHITDLKQALGFARKKGLVYDGVHTHIGSGGKPEKWKENISREISILEEFFPDAERINFGGGFKVARMPDEKPADVRELMRCAKEQLIDFYHKTRRKLTMEVEPGTYIMANAGYIVLEIKDKKQTGPTGFKFFVLNGGMELNSRPLYYGSKHPFYIVSRSGELRSSEWALDKDKVGEIIAVGRDCESGDALSIDAQRNITPRFMADAPVGDYFVMGGAGAYCRDMAPSNYNSHEKAPEVLLRQNHQLLLIRKKETLAQMVENEISLPKLILKPIAINH